MDAAALPIATKLQVLAAPGCDCATCTFIRHAYECRCPRCRGIWQAAFETVDAATQAMAQHAQDCLKREQDAQRAATRRLRPPQPTHYPVACGWCGAVWPKRFTTKAASQRFLREHSRGCYLRQQQKETG